MRIYRGRPSPSRDPAGWPRERPTEKGIDVALAVDFVVMALLGRYDVASCCRPTATSNLHWKAWPRLPLARIRVAKLRPG